MKKFRVYWNYGGVSQYEARDYADLWRQLREDAHPSDYPVKITEKE